MTATTRAWFSSLVLASSLVCSSNVRAQNFDTQTFQPAHGPHGAFSTEGSGVLEHGTVGAGGLFNYSSRPIVVLEDDPNEPGETVEYPVVDQQLAFHAMAAVGVADWFQLGLDVPIYLISEGDLPEPFNELAPGDLRLRTRGRVFGPGWDDGIGLAIALDATAPTGNGDVYVGADGVTVAPRLILDLRYEALWVALNQGFLFRPTETFGENASIGNAVTFGVAAELEVMRGMLLVTADVFGRTPLDDIAEQVDTPVEALLGAKLVTTASVTVLAAAGSGIVGGVGAPDFRMLFGIAYAPRESDFDDDGIPNRDDRCPEEPEDLDQYEDEDGCPDPDNDGDAIADVVDECPFAPEDLDGFEDEDGCPDPDNDSDGILDDVDQCPDEAEDVDGFEDEDGCPDADNDEDGIADADDECPLEAEDPDGFEDEDGCPEPDNDGDGLLDEEDACPDVAGMVEYRGCPPDEPKATIEGDRVLTTEQVQFEEKEDGILEASHDLLNQVAFLLANDPSIAELEIAAHTDRRGTTSSNLELSQRRADAVREYLVARGVSADRLRAVGHGESQPEVPGTSREANEANRRIVFTITRREAPADAPTEADEMEAPPEEAAADEPTDQAED